MDSIKKKNKNKNQYKPVKVQATFLTHMGEALDKVFMNSCDPAQVNNNKHYFI